MKWASDQFMTSGSQTSESTLLMAVSVMFSATSPRARWLKMFAIAPPGEAASSIRPSAKTGGSENTCVIRYATPTSTTLCTNSPTHTALG